MKSIARLNQIFRFSRMLVVLLGFFLRAAWEQGILTLRSRPKTELYQKKAQLISLYSQKALRILRIIPESHSFAPEGQTGLVICNHLSYLDILVLSARMPVLYITSVETGTAGWIGALCRMAGCLFVERRKPIALKNELNEIDAVLKTGIPVVLFPEATSSDGKTVLPFRSSLYECAIRTQVPIHAYCLKYFPQDSGVPYYGDMTLLPHLFQLCDGLPRIAALEFLDTTSPSDTLNRKTVAQKNYQEIQKAYVSRVGRHPEHPSQVGTTFTSGSIPT